MSFLAKRLRYMSSKQNLCKDCSIALAEMKLLLRSVLMSLIRHSVKIINSHLRIEIAPDYSGLPIHANITKQVQKSGVYFFQNHYMDSPIRGLPIHANITKKVQKSEVYFFKNYCHIVSFSQTFLCTSVISPKSVCHCVIS